MDRTVVNLIARRCLLEPPQKRHGLSESRQPTPTRKRDLLAYCTFSIVVIKPHCASLTTSLRQVGGEGRPQGGTHDSCCGAGAVKTRKPCWCERRDPRAPIPPGLQSRPKEHKLSQITFAKCVCVQGRLLCGSLTGCQPQAANLFSLSLSLSAPARFPSH